MMVHGMECRDILTEIVSHVYGLRTLRSLSQVCTLLRDVSKPRIAHALLCNDVLRNVERYNKESVFRSTRWNKRYRYIRHVLWMYNDCVSYSGNTLFSCTTTHMTQLVKMKVKVIDN